MSYVDEQEKEAKLPFYLVEDDVEDCSSTEIRERLAKGTLLLLALSHRSRIPLAVGEAIDDLTFPGVVEYLNRHYKGEKGGGET